MTQFIIATHSTLASGFVQAVCFFAGDISNLHALTAYVDGDTSFEPRLRALLKKLSPAEIIIFTDLPGGSVNRITCEQLTVSRVRVISGINLSLLLELILHPTPITDDGIRKAVENARTQVVYMNDVLAEQEGEEDL
ncbi:PTS sugar transporter subunit IIA [Lacticaseibacillus daqingensis]|uniref:PTS sugar transporter subunit IIA n=1 Tax=Lacticaseibacillus daqingensis TaxID=2486014 RepID=UPI000F769F43|nr:hypothetical protein [Lacticaseibacillus daqingensis]